jgi:toxin ParE1/3/4
MKGYRLSPSAEADLDDIWVYTATTWSDDQAHTYIAKLFDAFVALGDSPELGQSADWIRPQYRRFRCGHHLIFYMKSGHRQVEIVRVLHEKTDVVRHLDKSR